MGALSPYQCIRAKRPEKKGRLQVIGQRSAFPWVAEHSL
jgi:hypothetical protein